MSGVLIRPAVESDVADLLRVQHASPEASQWTESDYKGLLSGGSLMRCVAAETGGKVVGFLVYQQLPGETEVMNLAVHPAHRRLGMATALLDFLLRENPGDVFLEVRAGNLSAQRFYQQAGFRQVGLRAAYYRNPSESAIVMRKGPATNRTAS